MTVIRVLVLDFDGVLTDNLVHVDSEGKESVCCSRADSLGIAMVVESGIKVFVLSSEKDPVVAHRCQKMGLDYAKGIEDKRTFLGSWLAHNNFSSRELMYIGNDINDIGCLELAEIGAVVPGSPPDVVAVANCFLNAPGGRGAVREACDLLLSGDI
ncbi:hypothetical protein LCGC14_0232080 [marine sediment metagenome]|uniref:3-deoxy-D-manno-octulosonate 8-phosphate phosphatase n=1 Tax=marine sediment metagenome TaxID=412755 RepID=A0A0F9UA76_9ZZZZ